MRFTKTFGLWQWIIITGASLSAGAPSLSIEQITFGPKHHFFGYIGHVKTIPWNQSGRYILALQTDFQDHMPEVNEPADVVLIDCENNYAIQVIDQTRGWNFQQGTMFYWNPQAPETQFFFNDRDEKTNKVFTVLYDIKKRQRIREYRFQDTPIGNSGVAQKGGYFLGLNYGRLARLRLVTGYRDAYDWTVDDKFPDNDGIFKVNTQTGNKQLLVSYRQIHDVLLANHPQVEKDAMFINHTLWNRQGDLIYFYARAGYDYSKKTKTLNVPMTVHPDGTNLVEQKVFIGGHPEWGEGSQMYGSIDDLVVLYDADKQAIVKEIGDSSVFPKPGADIALSPDGRWLVSGYNLKNVNGYAFYRLDDGASVITSPMDQSGFNEGELRIDGSPCWNRDSTRVLFPSLAEDGTRQLFVINLKE